MKVILSAIEFLHKKFGKYLQPGGEGGDLTGVVTGEHKNKSSDRRPHRSGDR